MLPYHRVVMEYNRDNLYILLTSAQRSLMGHKNHKGLLLRNYSKAKQNYAEIILMDVSLVSLYRISSLHTRCLIDIRGQMPKDIKTYLREQIAPNLPSNSEPKKYLL